MFLSWVPVLYMFNEHVVFVSKIYGSSMSPTLNPIQRQNDYVLLWKWNLRKDLQVGDVVLVRSPIDPKKIYAKRVKGLQGDEIVTRYPYPKQQVTVPRNHMWCEGDNVHSIDSNNFGPVSTGLLVGKATWILYPFNRFGSIPDGGRECRLDRLRLLE